jgi:hypothetical protein
MTILNFIIPQFVVLHADVQMMILTAIMHAYRNTGPCILPRVLSVPADPSEVVQPRREQVRFAIHSLIHQAPVAIVHNQNRQGVRKFEFERRACRRATRELKEGLCYGEMDCRSIRCWNARNLDE